jgi:hypothetical protein
LKTKLLFVFLCILFFGFDDANGQSVSNRHTRELILDADTIVLDTLSLVRGSLALQGIDSNDYTTDYINGRIMLLNPSVKGKTVQVTYRTYPFRLNRTWENKPLSLIEKRLYDPVNPFSIPEPSSPMDDLFSDAGLTTYGSISRGISIGNAQDMVVNSNLNLQLSGKLDENIEILASITDQNIPVQPEGNTAQLKEFDKIFILLKYKNSATVQAGDIETQSANTYFMRFGKQGQGLQGNVVFPHADKRQDTTLYKVGLSGSMAKGIFRRQDIVAIESVQGPYQLRGVNGESYIMVLAGSERVYLNSVLLKRGEDADYTINYNSGEITFTSRRMITKDKRIQVEFEYSDRTYARSVLHLNTEVSRRKSAFRFNFYNEQDMKNQPNQLNLTEAQKLYLSSAGNDVRNAYVPHIDSVGWHANEILYKLTDTVVNGVRYDTIFVHSVHPDSAVYRLGFTRTEQGQGDYVLTQNAVNGRVYSWVAPVNGISQGDYAPVILLVAPKRTQMYSLGVDYLPWKNTFFSVEGALSNNDPNTFSSIGNRDNVGFGLKATARHTLLFSNKKHTADTGWRMTSEGYYEVKNERFRYIEDYREVSFARDYNLNDTMRLDREHFFGLDIRINKDVHAQFGVNAAFLLIPTHNYWANNNHLTAFVYKKGYKLQFDTKLLTNRQSEYKTFFVQNKELISKTFRFIETGVSNEMEVNLYRHLTNDSIAAQSFAFNEVSVFIRNSDTLASSFRYGLSYSNRLEAVVRTGILSTDAMAHTLAAHFGLLKYTAHQLEFNASYRYLTYNDSTGENTLLAGLNYQSRFLKGAVQLSTYYEVGSGLEQKNEYAYLRTTDGQGTYQWIDYNNNDVEELNEFEVAVYKDQANYIRIWLPSNSYIKTYNNQWTQSITLRPAAVWRNVSGVRKFIARFDNLATFRTQQKNTLATLAGMLNPFAFATDDTALVASSDMFRNSLSFNRTSRIFGLEAIYHHARNKTLNISGFERSNVSSWIISGRYTIKNAFTLKSEYQNGWITKSSEYLQNRNYQLYYNSIEGGIDYQQTKLRLTLLAKYAQKINKQGDEQSYAYNVGFEFSYNMPKRGTVLLKTTYYYILFEGISSSSAAYEMLEALSPGSNGIVNFIYQTRLWDNLQLNLVYEGRISESVKMRHTGSIELRAYF